MSICLAVVWETRQAAVQHTGWAEMCHGALQLPTKMQQSFLKLKMPLKHNSMSNLYQHASWRCCGGDRPIFPLSWRCWSLVELKPTATKLSQNVSFVAGLQVTTAQAQHLTRFSRVNIRQDCRLSTWSGSGHWQWFNDVWPRHCSLSFGLLPATSAMNDCAFVVRRRQEDASSVIRVMPIAHLQRASLAVYSQYRTQRHGSLL